ncbi:MAG: GIY-YIG nuclease family protein [Alphaproteobacteria bacterium]
MEKGGWVYVVASRTLVLYTGVTNNLGRRAWEHKQHLIDGFTKRYNCERLIYMEHHPTIEEAIAREKQLKKWRREKKLWLIKQMNPELRDLYDDLNR